MHFQDIADGETVKLRLIVSVIRRPSGVSPCVRQHYAFSSQFLGVQAGVHMFHGFNCTLYARYGAIIPIVATGTRTG